MVVVATVNGREITRREVDRATEALMQQYKDQIPPDRMEEAKVSLWKQALENLINQGLLLEEAERQGIRPDEEALDARVREISQRFADPEAFGQVLASMEMTEESFRLELSQNLQIETLLSSNVTDPGPVTDADVDAYYEENPDSFRIPERIRASHILLSVRPDAPPSEQAQKRLEIARLRGEVEKGADFAELARQHSDCPSKSRGGDLGYFEKGKMVKPFEDAAFGLATGEVSDPVETQFGFHLIQTTDRQEGGLIPLEQVRDKVAAFLEEEKKGRAVREYLARLRTAAEIEYLDGTSPA